MNAYDKNTYFIISLPEPALDAILTFCIESTDTVRKSNNGNKAVIKLPIDADTPAVLLSHQEYNHTQITTELSNTEWTTKL